MYEKTMRSEWLQWFILITQRLHQLFLCTCHPAGLVQPCIIINERYVNPDALQRAIASWLLLRPSGLMISLFIRQGVFKNCKDISIESTSDSMCSSSSSYYDDTVSHTIIKVNTICTVAISCECG